MIEKVEMDRVKTYLSLKTRISFLKISLKRDRGTAHPHGDSYPMEGAESQNSQCAVRWIYGIAWLFIVLQIPNKNL